MIRYIKLLSLSFLLLGCSQKESVKRYSYPLCVELGDNLCIAGTVFFLRFNSNIYLISALHTFSGIDPWTGKLIPGLNSRPSAIRVTDVISTSDFKHYYYDLYLIGNNRKFKTPDNKIQFFDFAALPMTNEDMPENILDFNTNWKDDTVNLNDSIFYYGYPKLLNGVGSKYPTRFEGRIYGLPGVNDTFLKAIISSTEGCSGSPVFKYTMDGYSLVGIISGGTKNSDSTVIVPFINALNATHLN